MRRSLLGSLVLCAFLSVLAAGCDRRETIQVAPSPTADVAVVVTPATLVTPTANVGGTLSPTSTARATATAARTPTAATSATPSGAQVPLDPDALRRLSSYRYTLEMIADGLSADVTGRLVLDIDGEVVAPDRTHVVASATVGSLSLAEESITVGSRTWVKQGGVWTEGTANFAQPELSPAGLFKNFRASDFQTLQGRRERVNSIPSVRYTIDRASYDALSSLSSIFGGTAAAGSNLPENFVLDLWVAEDGNYPAKMTMKASGTQAGPRFNLDFDINLLDVNDRTIRVDQPR